MPQEPQTPVAIESIAIEDELKQSYLGYAMSVIVGRALPDVRDGLKPVHRRVLFAMEVLSNAWNKPHKKSARVVGDVIGKYHPHGDIAIYDTIVRMAQPFSLRYMLIDGQGNFGSIDGDSPAAMRYTEIRMSKVAHALLADLDKNTVDFSPNYDGSEQMPDVLPTRIPNLLVNGSSGIAVGMATHIPPHNLREVIQACLALIDDPHISIDELMQHIPGPDFPTSAMINGRAGIASAYRTGRGRIYLRAQAHTETHPKNKRDMIVVTELPYMVNKARLIEKIAQLVRDKRLEGIAALRDESDKQGMRMVVEIKRGDLVEVVLNNLFVQTQMQTVFGINMVALDHGQPKVFNLKEVLEAFVAHRREVVTRRSIFELNKARQRIHLLEGLSVALANIDTMISLIKAAKTPAQAKEDLLDQSWPVGGISAMLSGENLTITRPNDLAHNCGYRAGVYQLSSVQAQAILEMRLHRLTALEQDKIYSEYKELVVKIKDLIHVLADADYLHQIIRDELLAIMEEFGDDRRTRIFDSQADFETEDLITPEDRVLTLSHQGYAKAQSLDTYQAQHRGGKGKRATSTKDDDFVRKMLVANTHDTILYFTSRGRVYGLKMYQMPVASRQSRGRPIVNLLPLEPDESITTMLRVSDFNQESTVFMATQLGQVKKVALKAFSHLQKNGKIALVLAPNDKLIGVELTTGAQDVMLVSNAGKAIRFVETDVRLMGCVSRGVRGIVLKEDQKVISLMVVQEEATMLTATEFGYGQRTRLADYRVSHRGGQGVRVIITSERNGQVVSSIQVQEEDQCLLISNQGTMVRTSVKEVSVVGRNTQGVRLVAMAGGELLVEVAAISADSIGTEPANEEEQS